MSNANIQFLQKPPKIEINCELINHNKMIDRVKIEKTIAINVLVYIAHQFITEMSKLC